MKLKFSALVITFVLCGNAFASDLLPKIKQMSKEKYLSTMPKAMNDAIIKNGGKLQAGAGSTMIGVQRIGDMMVTIFELEYSAVASILKNSPNIGSDNVKTFIKSKYFKEGMFGKNGLEKIYMLNYSCSQPLKLEVMKKGIITKYKYLLSTGEYLGEFNISIEMCK